MTDLTSTLSGILVKANSSKPLSSQGNNLKVLDKFLLDATQINAHITALTRYLRQIRQPYLSTAPPPRRNAASGAARHHYQLHLTDSQRDEIDTSTATLLYDLQGKIKILKEAEDIRAETQIQLLQKKYGKPTGLLWSWAAGGHSVNEASKSMEHAEEESKENTLKTYRGSILYYLGRQLQIATETQQEMVEKRIHREREKEKSMLYKITGDSSKGRGAGPDQDRAATHMNTFAKYDDQTYNPAASHDEAQFIESQLTPEQLQLFAQENSTLLNHYTDQLAKIQTAEKNLLEIASLQQTLVSHLSTQAEMVEQLVTDAKGTDENIRKGNRELVKANERGSTAKLVFYTSVGLCGFLVGWDLVF